MSHTATESTMQQTKQHRTSVCEKQRAVCEVEIPFQCWRARHWCCLGTYTHNSTKRTQEDRLCMKTNLRSEKTWFPAWAGTQACPSPLPIWQTQLQMHNAVYEHLEN